MASSCIERVFAHWPCQTEAHSAPRRKRLQLQEANNQLHEMSAHLLRVQDEDRRKIARELHDSVGQYLSALSMIVNGLRRGAQELLDPALEKLREAAEVIYSCASEVRTISYVLHPPLLDELGLASAVRWYVKGFAERSGIHC